MDVRETQSCIAVVNYTGHWPSPYVRDSALVQIFSMTSALTAANMVVVTPKVWMDGWMDSPSGSTVSDSFSTESQLASWWTWAYCVLSAKPQLLSGMVIPQNALLLFVIFWCCFSVPPNASALFGPNRICDACSPVLY